MATKNVNVLIKNIIAFFFRSILFLYFYFPLYMFSLHLITLTLVKLYFSKITGIGYKKNSILSLVSRKHRVYDVKEVRTEDEIDFVKNRSTMYIWKMANSVPNEVARAALGLQDIRLISDTQLAYVMLNTTLAHSIHWDSGRSMYTLDMSHLQNLYLYEGFYYDAVYVRLSADGRKISIEMADGKEYSSDDYRDVYNYKLAKLHAQVAMSIYVPAVSHNYVHFVFPSAIAHASNKILHPKGVLHKLLKPHARYAERINYQALRVGNSINNKGTFLNRYCYLWQAFPVTKEQIVEGIARICKQHYVDIGGEDCDDQYIRNDKTHSMGLQSRSLYEGVVPPPEGSQRAHQLFPPRYVIDPHMQQIPYFNFLRQYYEVIHWYVKELEPLINKGEWEIFKEYVSKFVPRFDEVDMVEAVSTFIMQSSVLHHTDHQSFVDYFTNSYGCTAITLPFTPFENRDEWKDLLKSKQYTINEVMKNPIVVLNKQDVMRTRCLGKIFVEFTPNPKQDLTMPKTNYNFLTEELNRIVKNFQSRLRTLDGNLKSQKPSIDLPRVRGDERAIGSQLVALDTMINCLCY